MAGWSGFRVETYPFYDNENHCHCVDSMIKYLEKLEDGSVIVM